MKQRTVGEKKSAVIVNGIVSDWFSIKRGCRQGDSISPYIFVLCVEILAIMIRENKNIEGITISDVEHKLSQFADDTEFLLQGDRKSFETCLHTLEKFGKKSGLFLNVEKTSAVWLGSMKGSAIRYMQHLGMQWNPGQFKILGIWLSCTLKDCVNLNYNEKFFEIRKLFQIWSKRNITPLGRIAVLKSLILSKLTHLWLLLPKPPDSLTKQLQRECFKFVWKGQDKINRKTVINSIEKGGLAIPDLNVFASSLQLSWIRKIKKSSHKWKNIILEICPYLNEIENFGPEILIRHTEGNFFGSKSLIHTKGFSILLSQPKNVKF